MKTRLVMVMLSILPPAVALAFQPCPQGTHPDQFWPVTLYILGGAIGLGGGAYFAFRAVRATSSARRWGWIAGVVFALALGITGIMGGGFVNAIVTCVAD